MNNDNLFRQIVLDHYKYPHNKILEDFSDDNYSQMIGNNPSCGDEVQLFVLINENIVKDVKFKGTGCSICCASASILTDELKGLPVDIAINKIKEFEYMISGQEFDELLFEDAIVFEDLKKFPARFKCAFISWQTLQNIIEEDKDE